MSQQEHDITNLLKAWRSGDEESLRLLISKVYEHLRGLAQQQLQQDWGPTGIETTALVQRAFTAMFENGDIDWQDRDHFFRISARVMRRIIIEDIRARQRLKQPPESTATADLFFLLQLNSEQLAAFDAALDVLAEADEEAAQIIELRFFGGFASAEIERILHLSERTAKAKAAFAKAWLFQRIRGM